MKRITLSLLLLHSATGFADPFGDMVGQILGNRQLMQQLGGHMNQSMDQKIDDVDKKLNEAGIPWSVTITREKQISALGINATYIQESRKGLKWRQYKHYYTVKFLDPEGPAAKAGIKSGDSIRGTNKERFHGDTIEKLLGTFGTEPMLLMVIPAGQKKVVTVEIEKGSSSSSRMVAMPRNDGSTLKDSTASVIKSRMMDVGELGIFFGQTLTFQSKQYGTRLDAFFSSNGVSGVKYHVEANPMRYCGNWWIQDHSLCWNVIGATKPPVCYVPYADPSGALILSDNDPSQPEDYLLIKNDKRDSIGLGKGSRAAYDGFVQEMAKEDRRVEGFSEAAKRCEQFSNGLDRSRYNVGLSYDKCMSSEGYPFGIFSAMSTRSTMAAAEMIMAGGRTMQQCSF